MKTVLRSLQWILIFSALKEATGNFFQELLTKKFTLPNKQQTFELSLIFFPRQDSVRDKNDRRIQL